MLALAFVVVYTVPSHRQANYLLPVMPALAVLLGLSWRDIPLSHLRWHVVPVGIAALLALLFAWGTAARVLPAGATSVWAFVVPGLAFLLAVLAFARPAWAPRLFHLVVFLVFLSLAAVVAPFEGPAGRYDEKAVETVRGRVVHVPSSFRARAERHRFLLPGADVRGYPRGDEARRDALLEGGAIVAVWRPLDAPAPDPAYEVLGRRLDLRTRQTPEEIRRLLLHLDFGVLVQEEILLRRRRPR